MSSAPIDALQCAIKTRHGLQALWLSTQRVVKLSAGTIAWEGDVHTFYVNSPKANRCYAWLDAGARPESNEPVVVLGEPPVVSPECAVSAWIVRRPRSNGSQK